MMLDQSRREYSSNEEMYAKLSKGATTYDLAQPTDNFLPLMVQRSAAEARQHQGCPISRT